MPGSSEVTPAGGNVLDAQLELLPGNKPGCMVAPVTVAVVAELQNCSAVGYPYWSRSKGATPVLIVDDPKFSGWYIPPTTLTDGVVTEPDPPYSAFCGFVDASEQEELTNKPWPLVLVTFVMEEPAISRARHATGSSATVAFPANGISSMGGHPSDFDNTWLCICETPTILANQVGTNESIST